MEHSLAAMALRITTLGQTRVLLDGVEVDWLDTHRRRVGLLLYLALEGEALREKLLGALWPDSEPERARHSLNQLIYSLRKILGEDTIITAGERVCLCDSVEVDARAFVAAVNAGSHTEALRLYHGGFLCDVVLADSPVLEHWAEQHRARIARLHRKARRAVLEQLEPAAALSVAHEWVELEPEDDEAQHRYLELLIKTGQRSTALKHYGAYEKLLAADGLTPLDETRALLEQLRSAQSAAELSSRREPAALSPTPMIELEDGEVHLPWLGRFIADMKRRHVVRVMAIYSLVAWGAVEIADSAFGAAWVPRLVLLTAVIASPIILVCAWFFDITPRGISRTRPPG
ncbi:MAG: AfsR/SARP family transcriptional regulator [Gemmatimonadota bacterium]